MKSCTAETGTIVEGCTTEIGIAVEGCISEPEKLGLLWRAALENLEILYIVPVFKDIYNSISTAA